MKTRLFAYVDSRRAIIESECPFYAQRSIVVLGTLALLDELQSNRFAPSSQCRADLRRLLGKDKECETNVESMSSTLDEIRTLERESKNCVVLDEIVSGFDSAVYLPGYVEWMCFKSLLQLVTNGGRAGGTSKYLVISRVTGLPDYSLDSSVYYLVCAILDRASYFAGERANLHIVTDECITEIIRRADRSIVQLFGRARLKSPAWFDRAGHDLD